MKKTFLIATVLLFFVLISSNIVFASAIDNSDDQNCLPCVVAWNVTWYSDRSNITYPSTWIRKHWYGNKYDATWYWPDGDTCVGNLYLYVDKDSFHGQTIKQENDDLCTVIGNIDGSKATGIYYAQSGDYGTFTAIITNYLPTK